MWGVTRSKALGQCLIDNLEVIMNNGYLAALVLVLIIAAVVVVVVYPAVQAELAQAMAPLNNIAETVPTVVQ